MFYIEYESFGSLLVSFLLIATAFGLSLHSYHLLLLNLSNLNLNLFNNNFYLNKLTNLLPKGHSHSNEIVDPKAMFFAAMSMLVKEYLYRITLKVATIENSNILLASAMHHRSDAFGSLVALGAIVSIQSPFFSNFSI